MGPRSNTILCVCSRQQQQGQARRAAVTTHLISITVDLFAHLMSYCPLA